MNFLEFYYKTIIQYDLLNKFNYNNIKELPQLKKIILNFKIKNFKTKTFAATLFALELITTKECICTTSKKPNIFLKIQKGQPIGGKVILKKTLMYQFLSILIIDIFSKIKTIGKFNSNHNNTFSIQLNYKDLTFSNLKEHYNLSDLLSYINITIITNSKTKKELFFLLKSFQCHIKPIKI